MTTFPFAFEPRVVRSNRLFGISPHNSRVEVHGGDLVARFGPWSVTTPVSNVQHVTTTGPYRWWRVAGPARWSPVDGGLTFASTTVGGLCITFVDPVRGIEPTGLLRHRTLTVTVADAAGLARALGIAGPIAHADLSVGSFAAVVRALWRHLRRRNASETDRQDELTAPPPPDSDLPADAQPAEAGVGPWFHRRYRVEIDRPTIGADALIAAIQADPNIVSDRALAPFVKEVGADDAMAVGDRFVVTTAGPWSGPVEVMAVDRQGFRLATLDGHMEAGSIEFRAVEADGRLTFQVESWARSGDRAFHVLYDTIGIAKVIQTEMWVTVCERVAAMAGGPDHADVEVHSTRTRPPEWAALPPPRDLSAERDR